jgi:hypothetical protein
MHRFPRPHFSPRLFTGLLVGILVWGGTAGVESTATESSAATVSAQDTAEEAKRTHGSGRTIVLDGWRRTAHGWEQFPFAASHPSINEWIAHQRQEEASNPLSRLLEQLGPVHPLSLAAAEIAIACLITAASAPNRHAGPDALG